MAHDEGGRHAHADEGAHCRHRARRKPGQPADAMAAGAARAQPGAEAHNQSADRNHRPRLAVMCAGHRAEHHPDERSGDQSAEKPQPPWRGAFGLQGLVDGAAENAADPGDLAAAQRHGARCRANQRPAENGRAGREMRPIDAEHLSLLRDMGMFVSGFIDASQYSGQAVCRTAPTCKRRGTNSFARRFVAAVAVNLIEGHQHRAGCRAGQAVIHPLALAPRFHQALRTQHGELLRERGLADVAGHLQVADADLPAVDLTQNEQTVRIAQGFQQGARLFRVAPHELDAGNLKILRA